MVNDFDEQYYTVRDNVKSIDEQSVILLSLIQYLFTKIYYTLTGRIFYRHIKSITIKIA